MYNRLMATFLCAVMLAAAAPVYAEDMKESGTAREVEYLSRGGYGVSVDGGIYLSWRLMGNEPIDQMFDIYRNDKLIVSELDNLNYTDAEGTANDIYRIVPHGGEGLENDEFKPFAADHLDVLLDKPESGSAEYSYIVGDASCGDVDNDGQYELIVKWDPSNYKDNADSGYTDNVYIDCYELSGEKLWRIDMGINIRAGSHYTQFIVYDFDGDGKAEMAVRTAPGSRDSTGAYVSEKAAPIDGDELIWSDRETGEVFTDESDLRGSSGSAEGKITKGPDWLTMFNGETGEAMATVNYYPQRGDVNSWGDDFWNRSERFLGGVAYLDGEHPSLIMSRGYYKRAAMAAYDWDGEKFSIRWTRDDTDPGGNLYGNGNHQLSVCDADNDGRDEIVFGSVVVDDDGSILNSTDHGHGDALHVSDFDNDGEQEIFQVHEESYESYGAELRKAADGTILANIGASGDVGRGLMGNFDDNTGTSEFFSSADTNVYDMDGNVIGDTPHGINPSFLIWWDGDLGQELLHRTNISKYDISTSELERLESFERVVSYIKDGPALSADLFGDWREEVCYPTEDNQTLRIFMTTEPTEYKIPTLMHDTQYRTAVAWQNVGYNQPPHTKYYIGKAALDETGKYLMPEAGYDKVRLVGDTPVIMPPETDDDEHGTYTVNIRSTGSIKRTLHTYEDVEYMSQVTYAFPKYILCGTTAYEADANRSGTTYGGSIANVVKDQDVSVRYTKKYTNVVYFDDLDVDTGKNADVRASNCMAMDNKPYTSGYILEPGKSYTVIIRCNNAGRGSSIMADGKAIMTVESDNGAWGDHTISGIKVNSESPLYTVPGSGGMYDPLDTVLIIEEVPEEDRLTHLELTSLDGTGMSIHGCSDVSPSAAVLPGVKRDTGAMSPEGYIEYTAPASGTLSFTFSSSAVKDQKNMPRVYYSTSLDTANKNNAVMAGQADGADSPLRVSIEVKQVETYYIFGYLYNMTADFEYTFSDIAIETVPASLAVGDITFGDGSAAVWVNAEDGSCAVNMYAAVYDKNGALKRVSAVNELVSGETELTAEICADADETVTVYIWDDGMRPYLYKVSGQ